MSASISTTTAPLYVQFAAQIRAAAEEQGLPQPEAAATPSGFPENENYFFVRWNDAALIVPKSKTRMGNLHSHIDLSGLDGYVALPKKNGRVVCHFSPDVRLVSKALSLFVNASKRPVAPPVKRLASDSGPVVATASGPAYDAASEVASWGSAHVGTYTEEDAEEALLALGLNA